MVCEMERRIRLFDLPISDLLTLSAMSLATISPQGEVHSAAVYFAVGEHVELYFFSAPDSQHSLDVAQNPRAAVNIYPETSGWEDIRGLQMRGEVFELEIGLQWDQAWKIYCQKFPFVNGMQAVVEQNRFYVFRPRWIRLVDNRRGFGFKQEWTLP
jgi:uncharacterized protein YhbP (UPF0306 family)